MPPPPRLPAFLLTRPAEQGARFAAALRDRFPGAEIIESPLIAPRFLSPALPAGPFAALVFTSETGVEAARRLGVPAAAAICVGDRTAAAARAAGHRAQSAGGDADALVACLLAAPPPGPVLHLHGAETRGAIAERLRAGGVAAEAAAVYAQEPRPLSPAARARLAAGDPVAVPLFSPRTAQLLATALAAEPARAPLWIAALSPAVAAAAPAAARLAVALRPDAAAMLDALQRLLAGPPRA